MFGYHGQYLRIDVSTEQAESVPLRESVLRDFLGGVGLGAWLLLREWPEALVRSAKGPAPCDESSWYQAVQNALSPSAPFICAFSPLIGSPVTTSAKFALVACSPLTGRFNDALCGSQFALAGKRTGYDALVIRGRAAELSVLLIDENQVRLVPARHLAGLTASQAEQFLRTWLGEDWAFLVIGPAGENGVRYAGVSHGHRHAGRGGLGAVLGAKRIKAIGVRGRQSVRFARPQALAEYARELSRRSLGPATEKYRELGTVANLSVFHRLGILPQRNFQHQPGKCEPESEPNQGGTSYLVAELQRLLRGGEKRIRQGCVACTIGCEHIYAGPEPVRLEYETAFALGPMCGLYDAREVLQLAWLCDELGMDTISAGGTLAWAMACAERGWLPEVDLRFGDATGMRRWLTKIARREGFGDLLAEGSRLAAAQLGKEALAIAMHCKGLELPGYDVRRLRHLALGLAVTARGADHNRSSAYDADFSVEGQHDQHPETWAARVVECEDQAALLDSLILCKFLRHVIADWFEEGARILQLITGWDVSGEELRQTAKRIVQAKKLFNQWVGWTQAEDMLPEMLFATASQSSEQHGGMLRTSESPPHPEHCLRRDEFLLARQAYYRLRGWDDAGRLAESDVNKLLQSLA